jgi:hypothetical protein
MTFLIKHFTKPCFKMLKKPNDFYFDNDTQENKIHERPIKIISTFLIYTTKMLSTFEENNNSKVVFFFAFFCFFSR